MIIIVVIIILIVILYNLIFIFAVDDKLFLQDLWINSFLNVIKDFDISMYNTFNDYLLTDNERNEKIKNLIQSRYIILFLGVLIFFIVFNVIKNYLN